VTAGAAHILQPAHVPFDVRPDRGERVEVLVGAPAQEDPEVGLGMQPGLAAVAAQVRGARAHNELIDTSDTDVGSR
jgi:hypothetical protein